MSIFRKTPKYFSALTDFARIILRGEDTEPLERVKPVVKKLNLTFEMSDCA
jgi:hypothetical protein